MTQIAIHPDSHRDHGIEADIFDYALTRTQAERRKDLGNGVVVHTVKLEGPMEGREVPCGLIGPSTTGHAAGGTYYARRPGRKHLSRMVSAAPVSVREVTVIVGPYEGHPCTLYTIHGGPAAPKEVDDPHLTDEERAASESFWATHALADGGLGLHADRSLLMHDGILAHMQRALGVMRAMLMRYNMRPDTEIVHREWEGEDVPVMVVRDLSVRPARRLGKLVWYVHHTSCEPDGTWDLTQVGRRDSLEDACALTVSTIVEAESLARFTQGLS